MKKYCFILLACIVAVSCGEKTPREGVSLQLANQRKAFISNIEYNLYFRIPENRQESLRGRVDIGFISSKKANVILDFRASEDMIGDVIMDGNRVEYRFINGHILIPGKYISVGENCITLEFTPCDGSLNRSDEFLYTLLVPDRASTVFPCFDQPDMKAVFALTLDIPESWKAVTNGMDETCQPQTEGEKRMVFKATQPISTYLFAFAAGKFETVSQTHHERTLTMFHRETDKEKLERNTDVLFQLHYGALQWLKEYTGIPYPFGKLDFVLIPGFQYSGMEHPGAIFYNDSRLMLDKNPSVNERLNQANLIAHEVSHQWFGNLVTMQWFNDVWLKEVFASFMADLIVNPQYPEVNHELAFLLSHYPRSYTVDRTGGANPIVQPLDNMLNAGTLYGDIIYHKSPIMMRQMVHQMGEIPFRNGVREYLEKYYMGNATWDELICILDSHTQIDLVKWAQDWTLKTGRPVIHGFMKQVNQTQTNSCELVFSAKGTVPQMAFNVSLGEGDSAINKEITLTQNLPLTVPMDDGSCNLSKVLLNSNGMGYGCFVPDSLNLASILKDPSISDNPLQRASLHISLFEMYLENLLNRNMYFDYILKSVAVETEQQIQNYLLGVLKTIWWKFSDNTFRDANAGRVEGVFWEALGGSLTEGQKRAVFSTLASIFVSPESYSRLYNTWVDEHVSGLHISETDRTRLAFELMIRKPDMFETIAFGEANRIENPDRLRRFNFLLQAASNKPSQRLAFVESLWDAQNRKPEPWVLEAVRLLHHPLRADFSLQFIEPMMNLLPEVQRTGDIFFPKGWADAILDGHSSHEARDVVDRWLRENPKLSPNLRLKVLQSADMLYRME